jgi:AcrR family transcriptional regulator
MPRVLSDEEVRSFRRQLCEVAQRLFAERGVHGVTLRALADEVGCSRMTPYRYFEDKAEILAAVRASGFERLADAAERAARAEPDPGRRLEALGRAYLRFAREEPHAYRVMYEISQQDEHRYPELVKQIQRSQQALHDAVADAVRAGVVEGDPLNVVHVLWAGLHGLNALHLADKLHLERDLDELSDVMIAALGRAVSSDPSPHAAARRRDPHDQEATS